MNEIAVIVATALSGSGLGGFFGWLFGRRQQKANANSTEIGNSQSGSTLIVNSSMSLILFGNMFFIGFNSFKK